MGFKPESERLSPTSAARSKARFRWDGIGHPVGRSHSVPWA